MLMLKRFHWQINAVHYFVPCFLTDRVCWLELKCWIAGQIVSIFPSGKSSEVNITFPYIWINSLGDIAFAYGFIALKKVKPLSALTTYPKIQRSLKGRGLGSSPDSVRPMTSVVTGAMRLSGCKEEWRRSRRRRAEFDQTEANPQVVETFFSCRITCGGGSCLMGATLPSPGPAKAFCHFWNWKKHF